MMRTYANICEHDSCENLVRDIPRYIRCQHQFTNDKIYVEARNPQPAGETNNLRAGLKPGFPLLSGKKRGTKFVKHTESAKEEDLKNGRNHTNMIELILDQIGSNSP